MPRRADVPCIECGRLLPTYRDSAPPDRRRCGTCIAAEHADWRHGTRIGYRQRKCTCDECRAWAAKAQTDYAREYRDRTGTSLRTKYRRKVRDESPGNAGSAAGPGGRGIRLQAVRASRRKTADNRRYES